MKASPTKKEYLISLHQNRSVLALVAGADTVKPGREVPARLLDFIRQFT